MKALVALGFLEVPLFDFLHLCLLWWADAAPSLRIHPVDGRRGVHGGRQVRGVNAYRCPCSCTLLMGAVASTADDKCGASRHTDVLARARRRWAPPCPARTKVHLAAERSEANIL